MRRYTSTPLPSKYEDNAAIASPYLFGIPSVRPLLFQVLEEHPLSTEIMKTKRSTDRPTETPPLGGNPAAFSERERSYLVIQNTDRQTDRERVATTLRYTYGSRALRARTFPSVRQARRVFAARFAASSHESVLALLTDATAQVTNELNK